MRRFTLSALLLSFSACLFLGGCKDQAKPTLHDPDRLIESYADLPRVRQAALQPLQEALARVEADNGTPKQMALESGALLPDGRQPQPHPVAGVFSPNELVRLNDQLDESYPIDTFAFSPVDLQTIDRRFGRYEKQREAYRAAIADEHPGFHWQHHRGNGADPTCVDAIRTGNRLEGLTIARLLADDHPDEAIDPLKTMFRAAELLSAERHPIPRSEAARRRREAFLAAEAVLGHPAISRRTYEGILQIVTQSLKQWPPEAWAIRGDRATGLHTYEIIRDGHLLSVLTVEEMQQLSEAKRLSDTAKAILEGLDQDELYYLETMQKLQRAGEKPYYESQVLFEQLRNELQQRSTTDDYPVFAAEFLLPPLQGEWNEWAADRALCQAWHLALAAALELPRPDYPASPLTGRPYQVYRDGRNVIVTGWDDPPDRYRLIFPTAPAARTAPAGPMPPLPPALPLPADSDAGTNQ